MHGTASRLLVLIKVADGELGYGLSSEVSFYSLGR